MKVELAPEDDADESMQGVLSVILTDCPSFDCIVYLSSGELLRVPLPDPSPEPVVERPVWSGPPAGVLPGYSAQKAVVFKTEDTLLVVHRFLVYPTGVEFTLTLVAIASETAVSDPTAKVPIARTA